jgi:hypothetical protein
MVQAHTGLSVLQVEGMKIIHMKGWTSIDAILLSPGCIILLYQIVPLHPINHELQAKETWQLCWFHF